MALEIDDIVSRCRTARDEHTPQLAIRDVIRELVSDPGAVARAIGPISEGGFRLLHRADDLTVLHIAWTPGMRLMPHDHAMFAVVGMYGGQEDNEFFRRAPGGLESAGGRELPAAEVLVMGDDVIHAVANTRNEYAVALHVYGGDFFDAERSEWDPETFVERPRDFDGTARLFAEANAAWAARRGSADA
jgi:predicted metal-dependent enzyme (double-stranded beta helix superfamily)